MLFKTTENYRERSRLSSRKADSHQLIYDNQGIKNKFAEGYGDYAEDWRGNHNNRNLPNPKQVVDGLIAYNN